QLTPVNEWFWTSGADGRLRIQGCQDCKALVHPPVPVCPACRSRSWAPTVVSGRATVVGFTVNHHPWLPGLDPPYVIANVALGGGPGHGCGVLRHPPPVPPRARPALRHRQRGAGRGPERAPHDQRRGVRPG